eukprot:Gb_38296 [translate_table: standard]
MNNNNTVHRSSRGGRQSLFYRDISAASPARATPHKNVFTTPAQAAAATALWRDNFGGTDPPPPPMFTLEDRVDFSPEINVGDYSMATPEARTPPARSTLSLLNTFTSTATPATNSNSKSNLANALYETAPASPMPSYALNPGFQNTQQNFQSAQQNPVPGSSNWWSPVKDGSSDGGERGRMSPVSGVVQQQQQSGGLLTLPPPREIVRPDIQRSSLSDRIADEEEWVTVFGYGHLSIFPFYASG